MREGEKERKVSRLRKFNWYEKKNIVRALAGLFPRCFWLLFDPYQKPVERIIRKKNKKPRAPDKNEYTVASVGTA